MTTVADGYYQYGGVPVSSTSMNVFGNTWFVAASGTRSDGYRGKTPKKPFATIAKAIAVGAAADTIILSPGTHSVDVSVAGLIPKANMQFVAAMPPSGGPPSTIITQDADDGTDLVTIDVDGVGFHGIKFLMVAGGTTAFLMVNVSQTTSITGLGFHDCWFDQNSVDAAATVMSVAMNDATNTVTGAVFKGCTFLGADATTAVASHINIGVGGCPNLLVENNIFLLEAIAGDCAGISMADPTGALKSYGFVIRNNDFIGPDDGGTDCKPMIVAAASEGELIGIIRDNFCSNCSATGWSQDMMSDSIINNYVGSLTVGGALMIPGT